MSARNNEQRVVVTGASGLLGRHVLAAFRDAGWQASGVDIRASDGVDAVDLRNPDAARAALAGADVVAHCAALPRPVGFVADDVFATNTALMYAAISGAEEGGATRILYASSFSVVGLPFAPVRPTIGAMPVSEDEPAQPQDVYAVTKWLGEEMLDAFVRRTGQSAVSLRMPWIHTGESFREQIVPIRDALDSYVHLWSWIDARDAGAAFVAAAGADLSGHERMYIAADESFSTRPSAELAAEGWPDAVPSRPLVGHESLIDSSRAKARIGFAPRYRWNDYEGADTWT